MSVSFAIDDLIGPTFSVIFHTGRQDLQCDRILNEIYYYFHDFPSIREGFANKLAIWVLRQTISKSFW